MLSVQASLSIVSVVPVLPTPAKYEMELHRVLGMHGYLEDGDMELLLSLCRYAVMNKDQRFFDLFKGHQDLIAIHWPVQETKIWKYLSMSWEHAEVWLHLNHPELNVEVLQAVVDAYGERYGYWCQALVNYLNSVAEEFKVQVNYPIGTSYNYEQRSSSELTIEQLYTLGYLPTTNLHELTPTKYIWPYESFELTLGDFRPTDRIHNYRPWCG